jgi:membrane-associated phospholipid phosphatase
MHWAVAYPVGLAVLAVTAYFGYILSKKSNSETLLSKVVFLAIVSFVLMLIIMLTKGIMDRPRYRFVMDNEQFFVNWWQKGSAIKELASVGITGDEFSSFPSGHSAYSMFAVVIFPALAWYDKRLEKYEGLLFLGGMLWWGLTAFSRMTVGAHYLTDVTIAGGVTLFVYAVGVLVKHRCQSGKKNSTANR